MGPPLPARLPKASAMAAETWPNLVAMFFDLAQRLGERPFLWAKEKGLYRPLGWRVAAERVRALATALKGLGLVPGDRVMLVAENRPEWLIADLAIMAAGGITVPAYTTNTVADHRHIATNSGARGAIVSTRRLAENLLPAAHTAEAMRFVIAIEPPRLSQKLNVNVVGWDEALRTAAAAASVDAGCPGRSRNRGDLACIIYTSGTGGAPKGVMLHHGAILHNCVGAREALADLGLGNEVFLSFLPLSHAYEHTAGQFFPMSLGAQIYYAEGVDALAANLAEARPTLMTAVPRLYEILQARILRAVRARGGLGERLFQRALELGRKRIDGTGRLTLGERVADFALERLVRDKMRRRFGGRLKALVSGGAALNPEVGWFFTALGLRILQGYGQTEAAPVISVNRPSREKMHTVGPPLAHVEVRIADDGEILVRGELVMQGYWNNPDGTREVLRDGWLHTGDIGAIDDDGHIVITDRKKDIIVNSGGDNVAPQRIEGMLTLAPEIAQAMVVGDGRPHLVALVVPDADWLRQWAAQRGKGRDGSDSGADLGRDDELKRALGQVVGRINEGLSSIEKVRRFAVTTTPFTIENGQLTPTLKVRRHKVREAYGRLLDSLYD